MRILAGTSGYSYPKWRGIFYPESLPAERMLSFYATQLDTVEANATFYRMPRRDMLARWRAQVPEGFVITLKAPQRVTHVKRLRETEDAIGAFYGAASALGAALGAVLYQLPASLRKDLPRLTDFLAILPSGVRSAFEFRHPSWFADDVYAALSGAGAALCLADSEEATTPTVPTADFGYLRLRRPDYGEASLRSWTERIAAQRWSEALVYFKHEEAARGPALALLLRQMSGGGAASTASSSA
ncbi:MAG TPA: DUF72 domain-containing protein [Anaeromyxobacteraceae bacterium]|nr:DUF72 domain-containing protein [Anaeromyxobacteraceae bacterium]